MFWIVAFLVALAVAIMKLGVLSVLVKVMTVALFGAGLVIAGLVIALIWRAVFSNRPR